MLAKRVCTSLPSLKASNLYIRPLSKLHPVNCRPFLTTYRCKMSYLESQSEHQPTTCSGMPSGETAVGGNSRGEEKLEQCDQGSHVEIQEGQARILFPNTNQVFYNPVQEFNRDLSIAVIKYYSDHLWNPAATKKKAKPKASKGQSATHATRQETESSMDYQSESVKYKGNSCAENQLRETSSKTDSARNSNESLNRTEKVVTESAESVGKVKDIDKEEASISERQGEHEAEGVGEGDRMEVNEQGEDEAARTDTDVHQREAVEDKGKTHGGTSTEKHKSGLKILEALAASGLRSIRYALEIPSAGTVVANDLSKEAYHSICRNIEHNQAGDKVKPSWREASMLMYEHREPFTNRFDVIDLDPYGSPSIFLDSSVQAVKDGGLLCVTCTDMSVLCGTHSESCHSKYGAMSLKAKFCHEMALRIVLASLESHANRYRRYILPLMSCSVDFYVRLFVRVFTSPAEVKRSPSKLAMVYHCIGCETFHFQPIGKRIEEGKSRKYPPSTGPPVDRKCDQCGSIFRLGGPIWADAIHDTDFVRGLLSATKNAPSATYHTVQRITGLLTVISEELPDVPLYYVLDSISSTMHCSTPKMLAMRSAILNEGYRVSISHANANAIKTDAPHHVVWDIMRCWAQSSVVKQPGPNTPAAAILTKQPQINASFAIRKDANPPSRLLKLARFPENPEANWGPKARAKRSSDNAEDLAIKRRKLQGRRTKS